MDPASTQYRVHQCSKCQGDTEYYCKSCPCDLCPQCKENHLKNLKTIDHDVVSHRDKNNYIPTQEICLKHPQKVYRKYCDSCQVPVCDSCSEEQSHRFRSLKRFFFRQGRHKIMDLQKAYERKLQQHRETIHSIRSEALFYRPVLLRGIKADVKTCHTEFSFYQLKMLEKAQKLKDLIDKQINDLSNNLFCNFDFKHRCLTQKMIGHIVSLQEYEDRYEQSAFSFSALQFLSSIKTCLPPTHNSTLHTSQLSMTESFNKEDVMESLSAIQTTERGNRRVGNTGLLKLISSPEFHQTFSVTGVDRCDHISFSTSDQVWVSDINNLILTNTTGKSLHRLDDSYDGVFIAGSHTVNSDSELIYIDKNFTINKLSKDMKKSTNFIQRTDSILRPQCVYWSASTGDLLVGMCNYEKDYGKVYRYNQSGQLTHTVRRDSKGRELYKKPNCITENNNGDVVVSDVYTAIVVTEREGRHRFSYTGHPSGLILGPCGICTDPLSHILVCDYRTETVHMLNKDGQFLSQLLTEAHNIGKPRCLSYDVKTHRLWVGSLISNKVCVYRYITRQDALTDDDTDLTDADALSCTTPAIEWK